MKHTTNVEMEILGRLMGKMMDRGIMDISHRILLYNDNDGLIDALSNYHNTYSDSKIPCLPNEKEFIFWIGRMCGKHGVNVDMALIEKGINILSELSPLTHTSDIEILLYPDRPLIIANNRYVVVICNICRR